MVFLISVLASILAVAMICIFLFANGVLATRKIRIFRFLAGKAWKPGNNIYGTLPMTLGNICVTMGAILVDVPIGILTAVFMARFCPERLYKAMKPAVDLLAGIPSVVYRLFGLVVIVSVMSDLFGGSGESITTASVLLEIMIPPTIIGMSESTISAVPGNYYEGALALGASHGRSVFLATLPAAKSGVLAGVILGVGQAIGETVAVIMVAGNQPGMPKRIFQGVRTLVANIVIEMGYTTGLHRETLITTTVALFVLILLINSSFSVLNRRAE